MFLPTWRPSTKAVVRPNYNGNQGSSRGVEDEVVVNFLPMSPKLLRTYPNREKDGELLWHHYFYDWHDPLVLLVLSQMH